MNKKINPKAQLSKIITQKCFQVQNQHSALFDHCLAQTSSNAHRSGQDHKGRKSKLQAYASEVISKLYLHERYCMQLFDMETKKYEDYYRQIMEIINEQYDKGKYFILKQREKISKVFELQESRILNFKKELQISEKYKNYDYEDRIRIFQHNLNMEINIIRINVPKIQSFNRDIHKYFIHCQELSPYDHQQSIHNQPQQPQEHTQIAEPQSPIQNESTDDLLGCDQELGAKASANTIRRRKYDVGRQNVIKQEDEDDTNSIVSDS